MDAVTNGIHTDSWLTERMELLLKRQVGLDVDERPECADWERVAEIPDAEIWECLNHGRQRLVEFARERLRRQMGQRGVPPEQAAAWADGALDPALLTIGFARRFATYKRATLFLHDPDRLRRLLLDPQRPIQLVIAGKAHPQDNAGKALIQQVFQFACGEDVGHRVVFLEDYDMRVTGRMVQGVDVWLNTPRRPMEASGTSGMKVLPNGGLNLSIRDGWWAEAYEPGVGWAFGTESEGMSEMEQDAIDAAQLYETLERAVIPLFYDRGPDGVPHGWIAMVKDSMRKLCPRFNTNRMVCQYVEEHYLPAARRYRSMIADDFARARSLADWEAAVRTHFGEVTIEETTVSRGKGSLRFRARVRFGTLHPEDFVAQIYAEARDGGRPEITPMELKGTDGRGAYWYEGRVEDQRPPGDFTIRLLPHHPHAHQPLDMPLVLWER